MTTFLFAYTLLIMLISIFTAASAYSAFLVSHKKSSLFASVGFLIYFFDVALVFLDDFTFNNLIARPPAFATAWLPLGFLVFGTGLVACLWLITCEELGVKDPKTRHMPILAFFVVSGALLLLLPTGSVKEFWFFSMRAFFIYALIIYVAAYYRRCDDEFKRRRLWKFHNTYILAGVFTLLSQLENFIFLILLDPSSGRYYSMPFYPERNFAENLLMLTLAYATVKSSFNLLSFYFDKTPKNHDEERQTAHVEENLGYFAERYGLSAREQEVMRAILLGKDNQNIASELCIALSTVKVHVHNILKKTKADNRQELLRMFWSD